MFKEDLTAFERKAQEWAVKFARAPDPEAKYAGYNRDLIQRYVDMGFGTDAVVEAFKAGPGNDKNVSQPLRKDGDMPTGLPFLPLQEEMSTRQFYTMKDQDWTASPEKEAKEDGVDMTYGTALAVLSLVESFYELGVDENGMYSFW
ncbi:amino-acid oxidase [Fusarium bulbicola]|nr:amino-acid oxidase [Fusarium bulbicola]